MKPNLSRTHYEIWRQYWNAQEERAQISLKLINALEKEDKTWIEELESQAYAQTLIIRSKFRQLSDMEFSEAKGINQYK